MAGGVFGYRARKDLVFVHGPLFDAVTGSPKRLADLDRVLVGAGPEMARDQMGRVALEWQ